MEAHGHRNSCSAPLSRPTSKRRSPPAVPPPATSVVVATHVLAAKSPARLVGATTDCSAAGSHEAAVENRSARMQAGSHLSGAPHATRTFAQRKARRRSVHQAVWQTGNAAAEWCAPRGPLRRSDRRLVAADAIARCRIPCVTRAKRRGACATASAATAYSTSGRNAARQRTEAEMARHANESHELSVGGEVERADAGQPQRSQLHMRTVMAKRRCRRGARARGTEIRRTGCSVAASSRTTAAARPLPPPTASTLPSGEQHNAATAAADSAPHRGAEVRAGMSTPSAVTGSWCTCVAMRVRGCSYEERQRSASSNQHASLSATQQRPTTPRFADKDAHLCTRCHIERATVWPKEERTYTSSCTKHLDTPVQPQGVHTHHAHM